MPIDKRLYMTFPNDDELIPFNHRADPEAYVYVVSWMLDDREVVKVGFTSTPSRWRKFVARGANVHLIVRAHWRLALCLEGFVQNVLDVDVPPGFTSRTESCTYLGPGGSGWCECYSVAPDRVLQIIEGVLGDAVVQG